MNGSCIRFLLRVAAACAVIQVNATAGEAPAAKLDTAFDLEGRVGVYYTDNVGRVADNPQSSAALVLGGRLLAERSTGRLTYFADGDLSYNNYRQHGYSGELLGYFDGRSKYQLVEDAVLWNADLSFGQVRRDIAISAAPGNQSSVTRINTGPTFLAHFGEVTELSVDGRVGRTIFSSVGLDSTDYGAKVILSRRTSERGLFGIGASLDRNDYSKAGVESFDRKEGFLRMESMSARTNLSVDAGYAEISNTVSRDTSPMIRANAIRKVTPSLSAYAGYNQYYPTIDAGLGVLRGADVGNANAAALMSMPRLARVATAGFLFSRPRTRFQVEGTRNSETAQLGAIGERLQKTGLLKLRRLISERSAWEIYGRVQNERFTGQLDHTQDIAGGLLVGIGLGPKAGVDFLVERSHRTGGIAYNRYSEFRGGIYLRYGGAPKDDDIRFR